MILSKTAKVVLTDIYCKRKDLHHYICYNSVIPSVDRDNVSFHLAKRFLVFVSCPDTKKKRLPELGTALVLCVYPEHIITKA